MKLLNKYKKEFENVFFDLEHESNMVQSRILSTILNIIEEKGYSQSKLSELTGISQPFISAIFNHRKKLNMEHIALFQKALGVIFQPPSYLSSYEHNEKFYMKSDYDMDAFRVIEMTCHHLKKGIEEAYLIKSTQLPYGKLSSSKSKVFWNVKGKEKLSKETYSDDGCFV